MEQAVTHDALVKFAAEKLGWKLRGEKDHVKPLHRKSRDYPGTIIDDWEQKGPHLRWEGPDGEIVYLCGCDKSTGELPEPSSWGVFGEGLVAMAQENKYDFQCNSYGFWEATKYGGEVHGTVEHINYLPMAFWEAWYELEHGSAAS